MVLNKIWKYGDLSAKVEVFEVNDTTMTFRVSDPKAREKILRRGMWNIVGVSMIVTKWKPRAEEEEQEDESIPMWIHLTKVPLHMFSWEGLSLLASPVGLPVKLHPETLACTSFEVAKIFVKVDVSKALPKEMNFTSKGKEFTVDFHYPWLPSRCKQCDKWGHVEKMCDKKRKDKGKEVDSGSKSKVKEVKNGEANTEVLSEVPMLEEDEKDRSEGKVNHSKERWFQVPQGKSGRSQPSTPKSKEAEIQISASKFTVLSTNEEEEGEMAVVKDVVGIDVGSMEEEEDIVEGLCEEEIK